MNTRGEKFFRVVTIALFVFLIVAVFLLVLISLPRAGRGADLTRLEAGMAFAPPHNEPVVGEHVARYKFEGDAGIRIWKIDVDGNAKVWFLNRWDSPDVVGHGFPAAWKNSRWGSEAIRLDWTMKVGIDVWRGWQFCGEHGGWGYLSETTSSQHAKEKYWLFGFRYKYR